MPANQRSCSGVWSGALGDPRDMAKAGLLEAQSPEGASTRPPERRLKPAPSLAAGSQGVCCNLQGRGRCPVRAFKEMSGPPTSRSIRTAETNVGSPVGREPYGDTVPVVVAGVTTCLGGREGRPQGEGAQVIGHRHDREVGEMPNAETVREVLRVAATTSTRRRSLESHVHRKMPAWFGGEPRGKGPA